MAARKIYIRGKVQRVYFREWTVRKAGELGVSGWIRNRGDGCVEVLAIGDNWVLDRFEAQLRIGSPASRVDQLESEEVEAEPITGFTRRQSI